MPEFRVPKLDLQNKIPLKYIPTLSKTNVSGLDNVDNTSDANKPVSTLQQAALNGKADLVGGVVPTSQIPALALTATYTVASEAAMLALTNVQPGDIAVRTDGAGTFILVATDPTVLANWQKLNTPTDAVTTVNGQTGTVVLGKGDVGLGNVDDTSDANKPISTAQQAALDTKITAFADPNGDRILFWDESANAFLPLEVVGGYLTISGTQLSVTTASDTVRGVVELATATETTTGTDSVRAVTPAGLKVELDKKAPLASPSFTGTVTVPDSSFSIAKTSGLQSALDAKMDKSVALNTQTGTAYTLVLADAAKVVESDNASANTVTIPPNSSVAFPVGTIIEVFQLGAGQTTVAAGSGVTLRAPDGAKIAKQYGSASIRKRATDEWVIAGNTVA